MRTPPMSISICPVCPPDVRPPVRTWSLLLVAALVGCTRPPVPNNPPAERGTVDVEVVPAVDRLLRTGFDQYEARDLALARRTLAKVLVTQPQHLEARVALALVAEASHDATAAATAWTEVERILVYRGKLLPFVLQPTLYAAARYYVEADNMDRAQLFIDELWRRFPTGKWSAQAQLMLAETEFSRGRWTAAMQACQALGRLRPGHATVSKCNQLRVAAIRMLQVGPDPTPGARQWVWDHPLPQGNPLNDVWVGSDGTMVAVGQAGTILVGTRGRPPVLVPTAVRWSLNAVWGTSAGSVYVVGDAGVVLHGDGKRWQVVRRAEPEAEDLYGVFSAAPGQMVAVGQRGRVVQLEGGRWSTSRAASVNLRAVWGASSQLFAVGDGGLLLRRVKGTWHTIRSDSYEDLWSVWGETEKEMFVAGNRKTVVRISQGKAKESVVGRGHFRDIWGFAGLRPTVFVVGSRGEVQRFDGKSWHGEDTGSLTDLTGVAGRSPSQTWAVGDGGTLLQRRGQRWVRTAGGLQQDLVAVLVDEAGEAQALGQRGMLLQRRGGRWSQSGNLPLLGRYRGMWGLRGTPSVAVGNRGLMVVRKGNRWERVVTNTPEDLNAVHAHAGGVVVVGTRGSVVRLVGDRVVRDQAPTGIDLYGVWGSGRQLYAVGNRGVMLRFDGEQWIEMDTGVLSDLRAVWGVGGQVIAVGEGGTILKLEHGRFSQQASPVSQTLLDVWGADGALFAVSRQGTVIRNDGGKGWKVDSSPAACLMAVAGGRSGVFAVGCNGGVLRLK